MTISTDSELINALANNHSRQLLNKNTVLNSAIGNTFSLWRATGSDPAQGAIPGAAAACDHLTTGAFAFTQQTAPAKSYIGYADFLCAGVNNNLYEIHDRIAHMGGLSGTVTTAQTVGLDLQSLLSTANIAERIGAANYSEVNWWLEWYTDTGATASNATINVTYDDGTSGNLNVVAVGGTVRASRMLRLNLFNVSGKKIRAVNTVTLSASTGTAGSFGITATVYKTNVQTTLSNYKYTLTWAETQLAEVHNSACLFVLCLCGSTQTAGLQGFVKIIHG